MKPSTLAVALLTTGVATAQQNGGGGAAASYKKMSQLRGADLGSSPRTASRATVGDDNIADEAALLAKCMALSDDKGCDADASCTWCTAGAVPSACYPTVMSSKLPAGVFECSKKASSSAVKIEQPVAQESKKVSSTKKGQTFNLKEGVTLTLSASEVDPNFCDASSPLSEAGYMNGELCFGI